MTKKAKILILLLLVVLVLFFYLILTSASFKNRADSNRSVGPADQPAKNQAPPLSEEDYKIEFKKIFVAYEKLARDNSFTPEKVSELIKQTLNLKSPTRKFIMMQTSLFIALNKMADYLKQKDRSGKNPGQEIVNQLTANYSWLND